LSLPYGQLLTPQGAADAFLGLLGGLGRKPGADRPREGVIERDEILDAGLSKQASSAVSVTSDSDKEVAHPCLAAIG
jgi:hypothetical protein